MRTAYTLMFALAIAVSAAAAPVITSVSPGQGPVAGGTEVTIRGTGFLGFCERCTPPLRGPLVLFGGVPAASRHFVDESTIVAIAPSHLPSTVDLSLYQSDGSSILRQAFTFTGQASDAFETILLPIYSRPVIGAFGSEFHTTVRASKKTAGREAVLYGVDTLCLRAAPVDGPEIEGVLFPADSTETYLLQVDCSNWPARLLYVPKGTEKELTLNLRVHDVSRDASSNGTEIPVVRSRDITPERVVLMGVPLDSRFRNTLRIYSTAQHEFTTTVTIGGDEHSVQVKPGRNIFEPAYAAFSDFPTGNGTVRVTLDPPQPPGGVYPPPPTPPIWAFVTVTNNETQQITTITPD